MSNAESVLKPVLVVSPPREMARPFFDQVHEWIVTVDHKRLGLMYIIYGILFLVIAGLEATVMRIQLAIPHNHFVSPQVFNQLFTMHGTTMVFLVGMPLLFGFAKIQGGGNMPAYGKNLNPAEVTALVSFLETLRPPNQPPARDASQAVLTQEEQGHPPANR